MKSVPRISPVTPPPHPPVPTPPKPARKPVAPPPMLMIRGSDWTTLDELMSMSDAVCALCYEYVDPENPQPHFFDGYFSHCSGVVEPCLQRPELWKRAFENARRDGALTKIGGAEGRF